MFNKIKNVLFVVVVVTLLGACANKSYVVLLESPDGTTGKVAVKGSKGEQIIDKKMYGAMLDGSQAPVPISEEKIKRDFGEAMAARPQLPERYLLYFESGGARLTAESAALLSKIVEKTAKRPLADISIIGHTDTVGKAELNESLALKRAQAVAELMKSMGLQTLDLSIESHGESNLLVQTPDETPEPRNRRVEISIR
jgi:outer membrane protein OmpA-like peptidoglycan-associated protein